MLDFYFIRHAESEANCSKHIISGRSNHSPLTDHGILQSVLLGRRFRKEKLYFTHAFTSPAVRTVDTAKNVLMDTYIQIAKCDEIQELDQGEWTGKVRSEMYTDEMVKRITTEHWKFAAPGGECQKTVGIRMKKWCDEVVKQNIGDKIAVFTHGLAIKCLLQNIMNFNPEIIWRLEIENTSITQIRFWEGLWIPIRINDAAHLALSNKFSDFT